MLDTALKLIEMGMYVFPTSPNSKIPLKGTHGEKDSTTDKEIVTKWFKDTKNNIAIDLKKSGLMVTDVDVNHNSHSNGKHSLVKIFEQYGRFPDTLIEKTPRGGLHYFFRVPKGVHIENKSKDVFFTDSGIELLTNKSQIAPSIVDGKPYGIVSGGYDSIAQAPQWLLNYMTPNHQNYIPTSGSFGIKKYTGSLLDEFVAGARKDYRNDFLMRCTAKMLSVGAELTTIYQMLIVINRNFVDIPLKDKEINTIFKSMVKKNNSRGS